MNHLLWETRERGEERERTKMRMTPIPYLVNAAEGNWKDKYRQNGKLITSSKESQALQELEASNKMLCNDQSFTLPFLSATVIKGWIIPIFTSFLSSFSSHQNKTTHFGWKEKRRKRKGMVTYMTITVISDHKPIFNQKSWTWEL